MVLKPKTASGMPMDLSMTLGGFHAQAVLELWLAGTQHLSSQVTLAVSVRAGHHRSSDGERAGIGCLRDELGDGV